MLIQAATIYVGVARMVIDPVVIKRTPGEDHDWNALESALLALKKEGEFAERTDLAIAAESTVIGPVPYGDVVHVMDVAVKAGFVGVGLSEPQSLSWRPRV